MAGSVNAAKFMPEFTIKVVKGTEKSVKALHKMGIEAEGVPACTAYDDGADSCLVCLFDDLLEERDGEIMDQTIVHEAVHCMQAWMKSINEEMQGEEQQAYMVEAYYKAIRHQM